MSLDTNFESLFPNPISTKEGFADNEGNPNVNFYRDVFMLDTQYLTPRKFKTNFKDLSKISLSV